MYILDIAGGDCQHPWLAGRVTTGSGGSRGTGEPAPGSSCGWAGAVPACAGTELCTPRVCWWGVCWCCYVGAASSTGKYLSAEKETRLVSTVLFVFFFLLILFPSLHWVGKVFRWEQASSTHMAACARLCLPAQYTAVMLGRYFWPSWSLPSLKCICSKSWYPSV